MSGITEQESSSARTAREWQYISPAIAGSSSKGEVSVDCIAYSARRHGEDTEECIRKAVEAGEIELASRGSSRGYDMYRLTARGRELYRIHMENVRRIGRICLEDM